MSHNVERLTKDARLALNGTNEDRIQYLHQQRWIGYPVAQRVIDEIRFLQNMPKQVRMPNLLVVGDSNNGKSTIVERYIKEFGQVIHEPGQKLLIPVLSIQAPVSSDEKALYSEMLERIALTYKYSDPKAKLRNMVVNQCREHCVQILIIDEFHSLLTGTAMKQREVMNALKYLCNELKIPIIGVGTSDAVRVLHTDPQHASRFDLVRLPLWELDADFQRLIVDIEKTLPLAEESCLFRPEAASLIHTITEGNLGHVYKLIKKCAVQAIENGTESISLSLLEEHKWLKPSRGITEVNV